MDCAIYPILLVATPNDAVKSPISAFSPNALPEYAPSNLAAVSMSCTQNNKSNDPALSFENCITIDNYCCHTSLQLFDGDEAASYLRSNGSIDRTVRSFQLSPNTIGRLDALI